MGDSYIYWARYRANHNGFANNLGIEGIREVAWMGQRGMHWPRLMPRLQYEIIHRPLPAMIVIHLGGNDLCDIGSATLDHNIRDDVQAIRELLPNTTLVFSSMIQRINYSGAQSAAAIDRKRKHANRRIRTFMSFGRGHFIPHSNISANQPELYKADGIHLSDRGVDIFLSNIADAVAAAM